MYVEFIRDTLLPELTYLYNKYNVWWQWNKDSSLQQYLIERHYTFEDYFLPSQLLNALTDIIDSEWMGAKGNDELVIPDQALQKCFNSWMFLKKDICVLAMEHVNIVPEHISRPLQNEKIASELFVQSPQKIIYSDNTSRFWIHPKINLYMNKNKAMSYTWNELRYMFLDFCTTNTEHFVRVNENIVAVNVKSDISKLFQFKYFHIDQISSILKQATFYLGRNNTLDKIWHTKTYDTMSETEINQACMFIDDIINVNHNLSATTFFTNICL